MKETVQRGEAARPSSRRIPQTGRQDRAGKDVPSGNGVIVTPVIGVGNCDRATSDGTS